MTVLFCHMQRQHNILSLGQVNVPEGSCSLQTPYTAKGQNNVSQWTSSTDGPHLPFCALSQLNVLLQISSNISESSGKARFYLTHSPRPISILYASKVVEIELNLSILILVSNQLEGSTDLVVNNREARTELSFNQRFICEIHNS